MMCESRSSSIMNRSSVSLNASDPFFAISIKTSCQVNLVVEFFRY
jgi:hypothetical protein